MSHVVAQGAALGGTIMAYKLIEVLSRSAGPSFIQFAPLTLKTELFALVVRALKPEGC